MPHLSKTKADARIVFFPIDSPSNSTLPVEASSAPIIIRCNTLAVWLLHCKTTHFPSQPSVQLPVTGSSYLTVSTPVTPFCLPKYFLSYYTKQLMENYDILNKNRCQETLTPTSSPSTYLHSRSSSLFQRLYSNERRYLYISCLLLPCRSLRIGSYQRRGRSLSS